MNRGVWFIKIVDGVRHSFPDRKIEWIMAVWAIFWAAKWILDPADNFNTPSGVWNGLRFYFREEWIFASLMITVGFVRLAALIINGTFHGTWYARYSPIVRAATGTLCGVAWLFIWVSTTATNGQAVVTYIFIVAIEFLTAAFVVDESADVLREWRNGRSPRGK